MKAWHQRFSRASKASRTYDGIVFDSFAEMKTWRDLKIMECTGEIKELKRQISYKLILPNGVPIKTPTGRTAIYTPDYEWDVCETGKHVIADRKGYVDRGSAFRIAVFEAIYGVKVLIIK